MNGPIKSTAEWIDPASLDAVYDVAAEETPLGEMLREAIGVIDRGLDIHGLDKLSISFNGGKDCTVLLHLLAAVLRRRMIDGIGYEPKCPEQDKVIADGAVVSPSLSDATLSPLRPLTKLPISRPPPIRS
ncbi:3'-phosphoadenosine 5'-phosphosulfate sulfotransferase, partial [Ceratobasidium sp. 392]